MPLLGALLVNLFGGLASFLAQYITKKAANVTAYIAVSLTLVAALWAALLGVVSAVAIPSLPGVQTGLWLANAGALSGLVAVIITTEVTITAFRYQREAAKVAALA